MEHHNIAVLLVNNAMVQSLLAILSFKTTKSTKLDYFMHITNMLSVIL